MSRFNRRAPAAALIVAAGLFLSACNDQEPASPPTPAGTGATDVTGAFAASARGRAEGMVVDPAAANAVSAIPVELVRTDTGEVVDSGMSGTDGSYTLDVPTSDALPDGTLLQVQAQIPPDHVYAYGYATPTAFPAGIGGTLRHNILLTGP
jgi:hypothetical protein